MEGNEGIRDFLFKRSVHIIIAEFSGYVKENINSDGGIFLENYTEFAQVYDIFMDNIAYEDWCRHIIQKLRNQGIEEGILCELGCGTGTMTELLAEAGYDMIGVDASMEMLETALEKKLRSHHDILYLQQDMRYFELYGTVRAVISVCDSLNYIDEPEDLLEVFRLVNNYLDPGGIFLFDMNTPARYESIGEDTIAENREEGSFIWENQYDPETQINEYLLTLFLPENRERKSESRESMNGSGEDSDRPEEQTNGPEPLYRKVEEYHCQRAYHLDEVKKTIEAAGMEYIGAWNGYTDIPADDSAERVLYMAREKGKTKREFNSDGGVPRLYRRGVL